ncbi:MAG TPA: RDD family protein [Candidatus Methylacidiphilales bacterium]|nr:RDD family protein [Candidatus Methylacidiphilales bacterium]
MILNFSGRKAMQIQTPEGVVFNLAMAGLFTRFLAWSVDGAAIAAASIAIGIVTQIFALISSDFASALYIVSYSAISVGYGIFTEWRWRGQSLGKRILRIRVLDASGLKLQLSQIVVRNLLRPVDLLPIGYMLGGLIAFFTRSGQRLGDLAANTVVVVIPENFVLDVRQIQESKYNSFRDYPHLEARLRQRVKPAEAALALDAVLRRDEITPEARLELFRQIAAHFRSLVPFEEKMDEMITDEQFVRNAVASIYRQSGTKPP